MGGPVGVFKVDKHERLEPVRPSDHRVHKDFKEKYGNSLDQLNLWMNYELDLASRGKLLLVRIQP